MDNAKVVACDVAADYLRQFGPGASKVELTLLGVTEEAFDLAPGPVEIKSTFRQKRIGSSGVEFKVVLYDIDRKNEEHQGRYVQWLDTDERPLNAREWWPNERDGTMHDQDQGQLITYSRRHYGDMWGPPQVLHEHITLAAARTSTLALALFNFENIIRD